MCRAWALLVLLAVVARRGACQRPGSEPSIVGVVDRSAISKAALEAMKREMIFPSQKVYATALFNGKDKVGCSELRSKRYISDGSCTSARPIFERVCPEWCLEPFPPTSNASALLDMAAQLAAGYNAQRRPGNNRMLMEKWRCEAGITKRRKVKLVCRDGSRTIVHVRVVTSCECSKQQEKSRGGETDMAREFIERRMVARQKLT